MKRRGLDMFLALAALTLLWQGASMWLGKSFLPPPMVAVRAFVQLAADGTLATHLLPSAWRVLGGMALALALALPTGLAMGRVPLADRLLSPFMGLLYPVPKVVFLPVIIVLLGVGNPPKIVLIALVLFFPLAAVIRDSARRIPDAHVQAMRAMGADPAQTLRHLILPCCLPGVATSLRASLGACIAVLYIAETFASYAGLGYFIANCMDRREYGAMYAGILALSLFGGALYVLLELAERRFFGWSLSAPQS